MTMNVKNGFSTLNRLLGKKNKGNNLSKSSSEINNLPRNIDSIAISSHLEQNRITPLPIATANAPFEQTFRITVLLPRDQLYVARLGAKTKLEKLLELICENKQLDPEKYEFRHPIDTSQVFSNELTIGAVGLTEIRLCHISEAYDNFNADEIIKLRHTGRGSMSSSEFSSKNSKHTLKTASPYSSTNSLNSIDSTGMSTNYRGPLVSLSSAHNHHQQQNSIHTNGNTNGHSGREHSSTSVKLLLKEGNMNRNKIVDPVHNGGRPNAPIVPTRKKRVAPRPPSRSSIPEGDIISSSSSMNISAPVDDANRKHPDEVFAIKYGSEKDYFSPKKDFHVSTPNLNSSNAAELNSVLKSSNFHQSNISIDCNMNSKNIREANLKLNRVPTRNDINENCSNINTNIHVDKNDVDDFKKPHPKMKTTSMYNLNRPVSMNASEIDLNEMNSMRRNSCSNASEIVNGNHAEGLALPEPAPRKKVIPMKKKAPAPPPRSLPPPIASPRNTNASQVDNEILLSEDVNTGNSNNKSPEENYIAFNGESKKLDNNDSDLSITVTIRNEDKNTENENISKKLEMNNEYEAKKILIPSEAPSKLNQSEQENSIVINTKQSQQLLENCAQSSYTTVTCTTNNEQKNISQSFVTESSSEDEEQMKIYNITLGKTIVKKPVQEDKKVEEVVTPAPLDNLKNTHIDHTLNQSISNNTISSETKPYEAKQVETTSSIHSSPSSLSTSSSHLTNTLTTPIYSPISREKDPVQHNNKQRTKIILNDNNKSTGDSPSISMTTITMVEIFQNAHNRETVSSSVSSSSASPLPINRTFEKENDISENIITSDIEDGYRGNKITEEGSHKSEKEPKKKGDITESGNNPESINSCRTNNSMSPVSMSSYDSSKSDVLTELNNVINENKIETVIRKSCSDEESSNEIESPKPSCLSNFKIQTYSPNNTSVSTTTSIDEDSFKKYEETNGHTKYDNDKNGTSNKLNNIKMLNINDSSENQSYINSTVLRSESFKSGRQIQQRDEEMNENELPADEDYVDNRNSYMSLQNMNSERFKEENVDGTQDISTVRRCSSSRLGIEESINLQSLIVMKTILNSRKGGSSNENGCESDYNNYSHPSATEDMEKTQENINGQDDCDSSKENSPKNKLLSNDITKVERPEKKMVTIDKPSATVEKSQENEKKWKYQGPPSINVSTWSERPKIQVSIKDDRDYIFGGGVNKRNTSKFPKDDELNKSSSEIVKDFQFPIKVKLNPVSKQSHQQEESRLPFVRGVEYKKSISQTGEVDTENQPKVISCSNTMTLGRLPKTNHINIQPTVRGFKSIENFSANKELNNKTIAQNDEKKLLRNSWKSPLSLDSNNTETKMILENNKFSSSLERTNSMNSCSVNGTDNKRFSLQQNNPFSNGNMKCVNNKRFSVNGIEERFLKSDSGATTPQPPFFQVNLRKTGLKEKIISSAMEADSTPTKRNVPNTERNIEQNSAKLELKLVTHKNSISLERGNSNQWISSPLNEEKPVQSSKTYIQDSSRKLKKEPTANANGKENGALVAPPPPPPPVIRSVVAKQNSTSVRQQNGTTVATPEDSRDELLAAIRNFNKTSLKQKT